MFTRSMMRPSKKEGQKEIERERERGETEKGAVKKRCASSLAECQVVRARLAAFPVRRSSLNEIVWRPSTAPLRQWAP